MVKKRAIKKRRGQCGGMFSMVDVMTKYVKPLQDLGPRILATGMQMSNDIKAGKNWKEAALDRIPAALKQVVSGKHFKLGSGIRRRRTRIKKNMAFIHEGSHECTKSELDLFSVPLRRLVSKVERL